MVTAQFDNSTNSRLSPETEPILLSVRFGLNPLKLNQTDCFQPCLVPEYSMYNQKTGAKLVEELEPNRWFEEQEQRVGEIMPWHLHPCVYFYFLFSIYVVLAGTARIRISLVVFILITVCGEGGVEYSACKYICSLHSGPPYLPASYLVQRLVIKSSFLPPVFEQFHFPAPHIRGNMTWFEISEGGKTAIEKRDPQTCWWLIWPSLPPVVWSREDLKNSSAPGMRANASAMRFLAVVLVMSFIEPLLALLKGYILKS